MTAHETPPPVSPAEESVEQRPATGEPARPPKRRRRRIVAIGLVLLVAFLIAWPLVSVLQPGYYARYPELRDRMDNWAMSTHGRMSCESCHIEPGVLGFVQFARLSVPAFYSQIIWGPHEENLFEPPRSAACQQCHTNFRQVSADGDLLIPHRAHVEILEVECVVCHSELVHAESPEGFNRPSMRMCLDQCHDGEVAGNECAKCHTRKHVPEDHLRSDWLAVHAEMVDTIECGECHAWTPDYCEECHAKRPASHTDLWKTEHAPRAAEHAAGCMVCHTEADCGECH